MSEIEKAVLEYLQRKPNGWFFFYGSQKLTRDATIEKFKKDKAFRETVIKAVVTTSLDLLSGE
jgi:pterin-4a-carbinolamine dehydratase